MINNYYDILDVDRTATRAQIYTAYKKLAKLYHPDRPNGDENKFNEISKAYNVLKNKIKKMEYDDKLKQNKSLKEQYFEYIKKKSHTKLNNHDIEKTEKELFKKEKDEKIQNNSFTKLMDDYKMIRENCDIESVPEKLFDGELKGTDLKKFNKYFEELYKNDIDVIKDENKLQEHSRNLFSENLTYDEFKGNNLKDFNKHFEDVKKTDIINYGDELQQYCPGSMDDKFSSFDSFEESTQSYVDQFYKGYKKSSKVDFDEIFVDDKLNMDNKLSKKDMNNLVKNYNKSFTQ